MKGLSPRIAVVGLGPAGLHTLERLEAAGIEAVGFEARDHVGGRLMTVSLGEEAFYEAGGEWIDGDHTRLIESIRKHQGEPVPDDQYPGWYVIRGERHHEDDFGPAANADRARFEDEVDAMALDLDETPWNNALYAHWDSLTLAELMERKVETLTARIALNGRFRSDEGEDPERIGLLGWLCGWANYLEREGDEMSSMRFPRGAQRWCEAIAGTLRSRLEFNRPLTGLAHDGGQVTLRFGAHEERFDRVVLAMPPAALRHVQVEPGWSPEKADAIEEAAMSRTIKIALRFSRKFWLDHGLKGRLMTDGPLQQVWDGSRGETCVLLAYLGGDGAARMLSLGEEAAGEVCLDELEKLLPGARDCYLGATLHDWVNDPYAGGGFFSLKPGYVTGHWEALWRPEGAIHFAGDHVARWSGFIEGALESAERAAKEVLHATRVSPL